ncbi:MAG: hypothetical protein ACOYNY_24445 [Caldilineaceae bacterium]|jgi:hypothetical protein
MKPAMPTQLLMFMVSLLTGLFITGSVMAPLPIDSVVNNPEPSVTLPWAMAGCWEHELFMVKPKAPLDQRVATLD